ncbi:MAG: exopolysaccharide biosynthesis polyprenyl glycosylphosphotransferase [Eubacteriales bacterium]
MDKQSRLQEKKHQRFTWLQIVLLLFELLSVSFSYIILDARYISTRFHIIETDISVSTAKGIFLLFVVGVFFVLKYFGLYRSVKTNPLEIFCNLLCAVVTIAVFAMIIDYFNPEISINEVSHLIAMALQIVFIGIGILIARYIYRKKRKEKKAVVICHHTDDAIPIIFRAMDDKADLFQSIEICFDSNRTRWLKEKILCADHVYFSHQCVIGKRNELLEYCSVNKIDLSFVPTSANIVINSGLFSSLDDLMTLDIRSNQDLEYLVFKRLGDLFGSCLLLLLLAPLCAVITLLIFLQDGKSPIYKQERVTLNGEKFLLYKFRTMRLEAEKETGAVLASNGDERITKIGKILRSMRLDEIPQLINVLSGAMSLVGPRPERIEFIESTTKDYPEYRYRLTVKAGLSGLAQVKGWYNSSFQDKLKFDLYYVTHCSFALDMRILFMTLGAIIKPEMSKNVDFRTYKSEADFLTIISKRGFIVSKSKRGIMIEKAKRNDSKNKK